MKFLALLAMLCAAMPVHGAASGYTELVEQDRRLATVGYRLAAANAKFCRWKVRNPGWVLHDIAQYPDREKAHAAFVFHRPVSIAALVPDGPADRAGVERGDGLDKLDGRASDLISVKANRVTAERVEQVKAEIAAAWARKPAVEFGLVGSEGAKPITLSPPEICASDFWVDAKSKLDAGADGEKVRVTSGLMTYTPDDGELAAIVAHELSHNLLGHRSRLQTVKSGKAKAILATEIDADRLSVWLMANAGYEPEAALRFWERFGRRTGLGIFSAGTHLRWKNRVKLMQAEIDLMASTKKQGGLLPPPLLTTE